MRKGTPPQKGRITLALEKELIRRLKVRAAAEGVAPSHLVATWIRTWPERKEGRR